MDIYLKRRLVLLGLGLFILYFGYELVGGYFHSRSVLRRHEVLQGRYLELQKVNHDLNIRLTEAQSDAFIELNARDRLGLVKPGETAYKIIEED